MKWGRGKDEGKDEGKNEGKNEGKEGKNGVGETTLVYWLLYHRMIKNVPKWCKNTQLE